MHMEGKKKSSFFPSSSSFESLSTSDEVESGSSSFSPKYPSSSSFHRKKMAGPRSPRFFVPEEVEGAHHFLHSCHLCKRPIGGGRDIFMYRGDTPFCSEECRQEQIEMDEANEKRAKPSKNQQQQNKGPTSPSKIHVRVTGTVVAG